MVKSKKDVVMRSVIFASIVLASGIVSFSASACDPQREYNQKISILLAKYQNEIVQANDTFAHESLPLVTVVHTNTRHFPREYVVSYPYSYGYNTAVDHWNKSVNTRSEEHTSELQSLRHLVC